ncbi:chemotaxis protein CheW [Nodosilinea sp. E11]|uniref:chemotaxis protein CheW n=1 Tax=Nodosilinea sp. E11 TaxID=3037479 RepID=UPI0029344B0F|nr:chemotaxis protein CheW [Nodosilinea sp. E11]WOD39648.1 chemotaxis protein CheW [Nodosilinea sp. E11]
MTDSLDVELDSLALPDSTYFLTQVGSRQLAFPATEIAEVMLVERSQILSLPFYQPGLLGVVHVQGQLVPLVTLQLLLEGVSGVTREVFNAVQLNTSSPLAGIALVIDQLVGNCTAEQLAQDSTIEPFNPDIVPAELWQPRRWIPLAV